MCLTKDFVLLQRNSVDYQILTIDLLHWICLHYDFDLAAHLIMLMPSGIIWMELSVGGRAKITSSRIGENHKQHIQFVLQGWRDWE